ncbi:kinase-like protein [Trametes coccinea BRFM310]|uniref:Kinase-like protein n=1 Tax=Trametes coccinea (strain BRFM310) TaxID=1353009 RepID=A0A1Y2ILG2_TRAC3|nr:kinase-like protein [Trametes coccinea BRFM310]
MKRHDSGISSPDAPGVLTPSDDIDAFRAVLARAERIVVLVGAELSTASGVPTFRGAGDLWRKRDELTLPDPTPFIENPPLLHFQRDVVQLISRAEPNPAHLALARFAIPYRRSMVSPRSLFTIFTPNVDGLERRVIEQVFFDCAMRSPLSPDTGSHKYQPFPELPVLVEMHGLIYGAAAKECTCPDRQHGSMIICVATSDDRRSGYVLQEYVSSIYKPPLVGTGGSVLFLDPPCTSKQFNPPVEDVLNGVDICLLVGLNTPDCDDALLNRVLMLQQRGCTVAALGDTDLTSTFNFAFQFKGRIIDVVPQVLAVEPVPFPLDTLCAGKPEPAKDTLVEGDTPSILEIRPPISIAELMSYSDHDIVDMCKQSPNLTDTSVGIPLPPVYVLASNIVVKVGGDALSQCEAKTMRLVRQHTTIPIPAVFRTFQHCGASYLVMEYIHGDTLEHRWDDLSIWERLRIAVVLRTYVRQFRRIRTPQIELQVPGPVTDDPCQPLPCYTPALGEYTVGPFKSYDHLRDWMNGRYRVGELLQRAPAGCLPFDDSEPLVFTHGDLCPRNIILGKDGKVWLIDFGCSGIYPRWFEAYGSRDNTMLKPLKLWTAMRKLAVGDYSAQEAFALVCQNAFSNGIYIPDPQQASKANAESP